MNTQKPATRKKSVGTESSLLPHPIPTEPRLAVERVQLGVRIEKRLAKVLSGIAQYCDLTAGEMLEDILLHSFEGAQAFGPKSLQKIKELKSVYELEYDAHASRRFKAE